LLIIAGGGAFQQILVKSKVGDAIVHLTRLPPLLLGWLIAMEVSRRGPFSVDCIINTSKFDLQ
jgi:H+/gluconate symporter-like permease